jgi:hypothetical protein
VELAREIEKPPQKLSAFGEAQFDEPMLMLKAFS